MEHAKAEDVAEEKLEEAKEGEETGEEAEVLEEKDSYLEEMEHAKAEDVAEEKLEEAKEEARHEAELEHAEEAAEMDAVNKEEPATESEAVEEVSEGGPKGDIGVVKDPPLPKEPRAEPAAPEAAHEAAPETAHEEEKASAAAHETAPETAHEEEHEEDKEDLMAMLSKHPEALPEAPGAKAVPRESSDTPSKAAKKRGRRHPGKHAPGSDDTLKQDAEPATRLTRTK